MITVYYTQTECDSLSYLIKLFREKYSISFDALCFGEHGKPYLEGTPLHFNLSHSGKLLAVAVSDLEVGIDVQERTEKGYPFLRMRLTPAEREEDFFRLWTAKEAYVKLRGTTLAHTLFSLEYKKGKLHENGTPLSVFLSHSELLGCAVTVCAEKETEVRFLPFG